MIDTLADGSITDIPLDNDLIFSKKPQKITMYPRDTELRRKTTGIS